MKNLPASMSSQQPIPPASLSASGPAILQPGRNVWRIATADHAAVLLDGGGYFGALRESLLKAQSTIFILGWDFDSRTRIVGNSGEADDGYPAELLPLLDRLVNERPKLVVHLLIWDYSVIYALEREMMPVFSLQYSTHRRIRFCLDDELPAGASHHQKIVVVDDSVAFCGGIDLTIRRWDSDSHDFANPHRVDPAGAPYHPYHDVQAVVDGEAARAFAELARTRWAKAACERPRPLGRIFHRWPDSVPPDFERIGVGLARTVPGAEDTPDIREVERLFLDCAGRAERMVYIENQYLTYLPLAERLAQRMKDRSALEVILVSPKTQHSWLETLTMRNGRIRFMQAFEQAGVGDRVRLLYHDVCNGSEPAEGLDTMIHAKVMVVDDTLLRIGSANLNNRSIGLDTECDLVIEATGEDERRRIAAVRNRMLGHHCGANAEDVAAMLKSTGSLLATAERLGHGGHCLRPITENEPVNEDIAATLTSIADPERPIAAPALLQEFVGQRPRSRRFGRFGRIVAIALVLMLLMFTWQFTPLAGLTDPDTIREGLQAAAGMPMAWAVVVAVFVVAGLVAFPVTLLIAATAATFGPWEGFAYAACGALLSAILTYSIGAAIGRPALQDVLGPRLNRIRRSIVKRGILAVATVRLLPIAPFTLVNLAAGASRIPFHDYVLGTVIGMAPGLVLMSALGHQILAIILEPTPLNVALFLLGILAWVGLSLGAQALVMRMRGKSA